jgi:ferredoxin-NADP reductase
MGFRPREVLFWLQDVREHWRVARHRESLREPGKGTDYAGEGFQDLVQSTVAKIHPRRMRMEVTTITEETPSAKTLRLLRADGPMPPFRAGQYVNVFVEVDGIPTSRPYSISSPPGKGMMEITVQRKPGGFVSPYLLNDVEVGDILETTGPAGHFYYEPLIDSKDLVFLAGGSGITPFRSMVLSLLERGEELAMHLIYGSRKPETAIFRREFEQLAGRFPHFTYALVISEPPEGYDGPAGFLTSHLILEEIGDVEGKTFYLCGPNAMYDFCLKELQQLGVPEYRIRKEVYGPPQDVTRESGWPRGVSPETLFEVEVADRQVIRVPAGEPLLNSLERHGLVVPAECRSGTCSACRIRLLSGKVFMPPDTWLREADREHGYIHACVSYPLEDLQIHL